MLGEGKIFLTPEAQITETPFPIPDHWPLLWGLEFGTRHPFAAALLAHDRDNDCIFVVKCIRMSDTLPLQHAAAIKPCLNGRGWEIPAAWPQDGTQRKEFEGALKPVSEIYRKHGMKMMPTHAKFADGTNSTEAGIMLMDERMRSNRFKVFSTESEWFEEYRWYHRKEGLIVKEKDDLMSATRVGIMALRSARAVVRQDRPGTVQMCKGMDDWDIFSGR